MQDWNRWNHSTLKLAPKHGWKSKPGYNILVLDRGAVRFDIPNTWVVIPTDGSIVVHDKQPPDDNCRLQASILRFPGVQVNFSEFPLMDLFLSATQKDEKGDPRRTTPPEHVTRPDLEYIWHESDYVEPGDTRPARSRTCLARGSQVHVLITLDFWVTEAERLAPVWDEVLRSLQLETYIKDPTTMDIQ